MPSKTRAFPIAVELLTETLERLEQDHYSDGEDTSCDGCQRAAAVKRERDMLAERSQS